MTSCRTLLLLTAVGMSVALVRFRYARADEDEGKPIASGAARVSRDATGQVVIAFEPAAQKNSGIATEALKPIARAVEVEAYGFILDPAPLAKLNSDLVSAQAALDASGAQYRRTRRLYGEHKNASLRDLQGAQAAYLTDKARVEALEAELRDAWGREIAQMDPRERKTLVSKLTDRREAIARVTAPLGQVIDCPPHVAEVFVLGYEQQSLHTRAVYLAPTVDRRMQGQSFFLLITTGEFPLRTGMAISAHLPTSAEAEQGVIVPRSAVVRFAGKEWVYREIDGGRFTRREIVPVEATVEGYFVTKNLTPDMRIVVTGAQTLLSEELQAQIQPAE